MGIKSYIKRHLKPAVSLHCTVTTTAASNRLKGKTILITGGSSGIGEAIAEKTAAEGAKVMILGRRQDKLKAICEKIGDHCKYVVYDMAEFNEGSSWFDELEAMFGTPVSALVNNAGIYIDKALGTYTADDYEKIMSVNVKAPYFMTQAYINYCREKTIHGNVVMTASNRALFGDVGPYGISKAALVNAVKGFARENVRQGIRVNAVAPGMTASEINHIDVEGNLHAPYTRGGRVLLPAEIAEVVCFLLSDCSQCITGAVIPCDAGDSLR